jgi:hypothetical protein
MKTAFCALLAVLAVQAVAAGDSKSSSGGDSYGSAPAASSGYSSGHSSDSYAPVVVDPPTVTTVQVPVTTTRNVVTPVTTTKQVQVPVKTSKVVEVAGTPQTLQKREACMPATSAVTVEASYACPAGYAASGAGAAMTCTKQVCSTPAPVATVVSEQSTKCGTVVTPTGYATDKYGMKYAKSSKGDGYAPAPASSGGDGYAPAPAPATYVPVPVPAPYVPAPAPAPQVVCVPVTTQRTVMVEQSPVCTTVTCAVTMSCATGTMSGSVCVTGTKTDPCPAGFNMESSSNTCVRLSTTTVPGTPTCECAALLRPGPAVSRCMAPSRGTLRLQRPP